MEAQASKQGQAGIYFCYAQTPWLIIKTSVNSEETFIQGNTYGLHVLVSLV